MKKNIAVIIAGCGHLDGAELRESIITLLELDKHDANVSIFAPDIAQKDVINHLTGQPMEETRNVLIESARIARGKIQDISNLEVNKFDALVMPGGFGAAKNLANIAEKGGKGEVTDSVKYIIREFIKSKKPIGAICISPAVVASALRDFRTPLITLGEANDMIKDLGAIEQVCSATQIAVDESNKIVTTPAYMTNDRLSNIAQGIAKLVTKIIEMA